MADDTDSDSGSVGLKRRIADQEDLFLQKHQEPSIYFTVPKQDFEESSETLLMPSDEQEPMDLSPKRKIKCSFHESQLNIRDNQQLGVDHDVGRVTVVEHNQEMVDSSSLKRSVSGTECGVFEMKIENGGQEGQERWDIDAGFIAGAATVVQEGDFSGSVDGKEGDFGKVQLGFSEVQESNKLNGDFLVKRVASEGKKSVSEVEMGPGFNQKLVSYENEKIVTGPEMGPGSKLEYEKKRLLAELEVGMFFEDKTRVEKVTCFRSISRINEKGNGGRELQKVLQNDGEETAPLKGTDGLISRSLEIEVIDDTALIETVFLVPTARIAPAKEAETMGSGKDAERHHEKNGGKDGKKAKRLRRKGKGKGKDGKLVSGTSESCKTFIHFLELDNCGEKNGDHAKRMYSRIELHSLRFAKIVEQRKLWKDICTGLGPAIMKEYNDLACTKPQKRSHLNFAKKEDSSAIPREECSENMDNELAYLEDFQMENLNVMDLSFNQNIMNEDSHIVVEEAYSEEDDSDEDYNSILKPAFLVEGEPDFDSGPPEDGLEYLRRVRWEAAQIPKVKVAKLDKNKKKKEQSVYMPQIPEIAKCPPHLLPLREWEDAFLFDFSELRLALSHLEDPSTETSGRIQPIVTANEENAFSQLMDNIIVEKFINLTTQEVESSHISDDSSLESSNDQPNSSAKENETSPCCKNQHSKASVGGSPGDYPTLSVICRMDSVTRVSTLRKRINSLEAKSGLSKKECAWLFALCAAVDTPLNGDTCASIRSLLRKCASIRAGKSEVDDEVIMLNILVTISGRYFGQLDA